MQWCRGTTLQQPVEILPLFAKDDVHASLQSTPWIIRSSCQNLTLIIRGALSRILGATLTADQWTQASLPVAMGGLGLRSAADHASTAHAAGVSIIFKN